MKCLAVVVMLAGLFIARALSEESPATHTEEVLDAPGGRAVAILLPGSPRRVLEEKNGYRRVAFEGWIRISPPEEKAGEGRAPVGTEPSAPVPSEIILPPASPVPAARALSGRIVIRLASGEIRYGAGARLLALGNVEELEARRASLAAAYRTERQDLQQQLQQLEAEKARALGSSDNLNQATQRLDRAKAGLVQKNRDLQALDGKFAVRETALLEDFRVAESFADANGVYRLEGLEAGEWRIWAIFSDSGSTYRWYAPATVPAGKTGILDLTATRAGEDPFLQTP